MPVPNASPTGLPVAALARAGGRRILIVEDDAIIAFCMSAVLEEAGFQVVDVVASGALAIDRVRGAAVDLVLADVRLRGDLDGIETARTLRDLRPALAVVFVTGESDPGTTARIQAARPAGHLLKPFDPAGLVRLVRGALGA